MRNVARNSHFEISQRWKSQDNIEAFHYEEPTCHNAAILEEIPAVVCNVSGSLKTAAKSSILLHCVARPYSLHKTYQT